jgi:hypothetical protein
MRIACGIFADVFGEIIGVAPGVRLWIVREYTCRKARVLVFKQFCLGGELSVVT